MEGRWLSVSVSVLVILLAAPLPAQSLINGSFESPVVSNGTYAAVTPTGWTGGSLVFDTDPPVGITSQPFTWPLPQDGDQYEDIGNQSSSAMTQAFSIATPGAYELAWYENTALTVAGFQSPYSVSIFDSQLSVVTSGTFDASNLGQWDRMSLSQVLPIGSYTVEFKPLGAFGGADTLVDNVTLTAVPEPATAMIFVVTIAMGAIWMRRRY